MEHGMAKSVPAAPIALIVAGCILAACANPNADKAVAAQRSLFGMPSQTLLSCAGVPDRSAQVDNTEFLTYVTGGASYGGPSTSVGVSGGSGGTGLGIGLGIPLGSWGGGSGGCEATFTVRNGVVQQVVYNGPSGSGAALGQCYRIVENCLAVVPPGRVTP
jgi:hypothetical protein